jgi:hypothetical protein
MSRASKNEGLKPFTGILAEPLDVPNVLLVALQAIGQSKTVSRAIYRAAEEYLAQQKWDRLVALAEHYGVDLPRQRLTPDPIVELLLKVAADVCPGFRTKRDPRNAPTVGKPRHRNFDDNLSLFAAMDEKMSKGTMSALGACKSISKDRKSKWHGNRPQALYARYTRIAKEVKSERLNDKLAADIAEIKRAGARGT